MLTRVSCLLVTLVKMRLQSLPTLVIIPINMWRAQRSSSDPWHIVGLKHECQRVIWQVFGLLIAVLYRCFIGGRVWTVRSHTQVQASSCTQTGRYGSL